jgi:hypothetical protein
MEVLKEIVWAVEEGEVREEAGRHDRLEGDLHDHNAGRDGSHVFHLQAN